MNIADPDDLVRSLVGRQRRLKKPAALFDAAGFVDLVAGARFELVPPGESERPPSTQLSAKVEFCTEIADFQYPLARAAHISAQDSRRSLTRFIVDFRLDWMGAVREPRPEGRSLRIGAFNNGPRVRQKTGSWAAHKGFGGLSTWVLLQPPNAMMGSDQPDRLDL